MVVENLLPTDGGENVDPTSAPKSLNAITVQLEENLKEEQRFNCQMLYTVFKHCLNPIQVSTTFLLLSSVGTSWHPKCKVPFRHCLLG